MAAVVKRAGLPFDAVVTTELARGYKPAPAVYQLAVDLYRPDEIRMVACHKYDLKAEVAFVAYSLEFGPSAKPDTAPETWFDLHGEAVDSSRRDTEREKAIASCLLTLAYFRASARGRFLLRFGLIEINSGTNEIFQSTLINLVALEKIDRSPHLAFEARVEELVGIREARSVGKGKLHLVLMGVADRDDPVARPHRASHPLPFLDDLPIGRKDALADAGERFATPIPEFCDQLVNIFRWIH